MYRQMVGLELTSIIRRTRIQPETVLRKICIRACAANMANLSTAPRANALLPGVHVGCRTERERERTDRGSLGVASTQITSKWILAGLIGELIEIPE